MQSTVESPRNEPEPRDQNGPRAPASAFTFDPAVAYLDVKLESYMKENSQYDAIAVGALVFYKNAEEERLLLIQRSPQDSFPLLWEIPGGACDLEDNSLLDGLARELWEETGLLLRHVKQRVGIAAGGDVDTEAIFTTKEGRHVIKFSFVVDVEQPAEVRLNEREHRNFLWATEEECLAGKAGAVELKFTTDQQFGTIREVFRLRRE